jgi:hypothetical protein
MSNLLNWGFQPIGTPLGSESALSMPQDELTGLEDPMAANQSMLEGFAEQTQRRYGNISDPGGSIWDPRGDRALSHEVSDYRTSDFMRPDEIPVSIADMSPELMGGDPVLAPYAASNQLDPTALKEAGLGLSDAGAATLADSLSVVDPAFLDRIYLPVQVEPEIVNEMGLVTKHGGLPEAFFDRNAGVLHQGMPETIERVIAGQGQYQYVDDNGVVDKYDQGSGPYDSPGLTRPGSLLGAARGTVIRTREGIKYGGMRRRLTPADVAASPRLAMGAALGQVPGAPPGFGEDTGTAFSRATAARLRNAGGPASMSNADPNQQNTAPGGCPQGMTFDLASNSCIPICPDGMSYSFATQRCMPLDKTPGSDGSVGVNNGASSGLGSGLPSKDVSFESEGMFTDSVAAPEDFSECPSWKLKCWWPIAVGTGLAAIGAYLALRKKKKGK